jgi:predicted small lipoprotein YifL
MRLYFWLDVLMISALLWSVQSCGNRRLESVPDSEQPAADEQEQQDRPQVCDCVCEDGSAYTKITRGQRVSRW